MVNVSKYIDVIVLALFTAFLLVIPGIGLVLAVLRNYFKGSAESPDLIQP
jgi:hypothetical protein